MTEVVNIIAQRRRLGRTDIQVSPIAFGCASVGNLYSAISDEHAQGVLQAAWNAGLRYFDTAPHYGRGLSEQRLGDFLATQNQHEAVVSTKVGRLLSPGNEMAEADGFVNPLPNTITHDYTGDGIEASLDASCERLGRGFIDVLYVHDLGRYTHGDGNVAHQTDFLSSGYERLVQLKESRRIGAFGLGVNEVEVCLEVMDHCALDVILLAGRLTLLDRVAETDLVPRCLANGTSLVLGGVFNSGILATGPTPGATYDYSEASKDILDAVTTLQTKAEKLGMSLAQAALYFALSHPAAASVLIGTSNVKSLTRNIELANLGGHDSFAKVFK